MITDQLSRNVKELPLSGARRDRMRVVLAEDDREMRRLLARGLRRDGYEVVEFGDGKLLMDHLMTSMDDAGRVDVDVVVSDIRMPGLSGLQVLELLRMCEDEMTPVILITAFGDHETHRLAERMDAVAVFDKPFDIDSLRAFVRQLLPPGPDTLARKPE